jgi:hypothetical protein
MVSANAKMEEVPEVLAWQMSVVRLLVLLGTLATLASAVGGWAWD